MTDRYRVVLDVRRSLVSGLAVLLGGLAVLLGGLSVLVGRLVARWRDAVVCGLRIGRTDRVVAGFGGAVFRRRFACGIF